MTRDQFNRLLQNPATIDLNFVSDLEEITRQFPYFTNAHLLLAKQYHGHENIRYENYLRKASAYAPDRTVLYQLIRTTPLEIVHIREPERIAETETERIAETETERIAETETERSEQRERETERIAETETEQSEQRERETERIAETEIEQSEQRERETERIAETETERIAETETERIAETETETEQSEQREWETERIAETEIEQSEQRERETERIDETETVAETVAETESETETIAASEIELPQETVTTNPTHSFLDWLKIKSVPVIPAEELADFLLRDRRYDEVNESIKRPTDMIEKFIQGEPRIVPKKSEFYSPGNMARASATEPEDLVSETLARIYAQQGNIPKAIEAYRKLSLKFPEKNSYFAALIQELEGQQSAE